MCVRICNSTWRTIYTYNNKYHSPKSNIITLNSVDCWIIYYLFSAAYPKWEYAINYMTLRFYCRVICRYHGMTCIIICYHGAWHHTYDIMAWHHIYTDIITPFGNKVAHRCSFRIALFNLRGDIIEYLNQCLLTKWINKGSLFIKCLYW